MVASPQQTKQPTNEARGILPERRKTPNGLFKCLRRTPLYDLYNIEKIENHHYEELQEKYNRVFFNIQNNMQNNVQSNMQRQDEMNENYELIEERETTV